VNSINVADVHKKIDLFEKVAVGVLASSENELLTSNFTA
jgi:hypothetical protein